MVMAGPHDVPNGCPRCQQMTLHRPGPDGQLHCMPCMTRPSQQFAIQQHVQHQPPRPPVIQVQQKVGGGVVRGTIDAAKFIVALLFLGTIGTCVYVCGSAAKATESSSAAPSYTPPVRSESVPTAPARDLEAEKAAEIERLADEIGALKPTADGRVKFASAVGRMLILQGTSINLQATGANRTTLEIAVFGGACTSDELTAIRKDPRMTDPAKRMGFRKLRCAPEGPEVALFEATGKAIKSETLSSPGRVLDPEEGREDFAATINDEISPKGTARVDRTTRKRLQIYAPNGGCVDLAEAIASKHRTRLKSLGFTMVECGLAGAVMLDEEPKPKAEPTAADTKRDEMLEGLE